MTPRDARDAAPTQPTDAKGAIMSPKFHRAGLAGLIAGLGLGAALPPPARGQQAPPAAMPDALPPLPAAAGPVPIPAPAEVATYAAPAEVRPTPPVVQVPPSGIRPTWFREADDPVAVERKGPKHLEFKRCSAAWRRLQGRFYGYPEEFTPRPLGAALYDHNLAMTANAAAARLTLYQFDFVQGSDQLSPRGVEQLARLVPQLLASPFPLIVERTPADPALAARRREAVALRLAQGPCPIPPDRVLVGAPIANGLSGVDAQVIAGNALGRVQQYGPPIPLESNGVNSPTGVTINSGVVSP